MNDKTLKTLEFNKIIEQLSQYADSDFGKQLCYELSPLTALSDIQNLQGQTTDALSKIFKKGTLSFSGIKDIRPSLRRLQIGSSLNIPELLQISSNLDGALRVKGYGRSDHLDEETDSLTDLFESLEPLTPLNNEIKRIILSEEEISDHASPTLKDIRRTIRNAKGRIQNELSKILNSTSSRSKLQEGLVTMRNGRYCLPVKSEHKGSFQGMIHDQSSTGSTLFIEPISVVKLNNELRELEIAEQEEINKILAELGNLVFEDEEIIKNDFLTMGELDFIFARGNLSKEMNGSEPKMNTDGYINIKQARHPLIAPDKVVPIDIILGKDYSMLIITGPNTGGKTVSLKTTGLLTIMAQSGLHIPAFDGSCINVFEQVFADIGDEQSIEQSLSTFSSHMTNIVPILEKANNRSLVLFDELGAGTDPTEGAALAMAILSHLHQNKITTLATTHYSELKLYALSTPGISNASCEFDITSLRPTYRLIIGIPGKSNAFSISSKLGLPDYIIDEASKLIGQQEKSFEDIITDLESNRITLEKERIEIETHKREIDLLKKSLESKTESLDNHRDQLISQAKEEASRLLQEAKDYADETIMKYNKWGKSSPSIKDMEEERTKLRDKINKQGSGLNKARPNTSKKLNPKDLTLGESIHVISLGLDGTITGLPNAKGELQVQMGILNSIVNIRDIKIIDEERISSPHFRKTQGGRVSQPKSMTISTEINLIGKTVDDAIFQLDKYLDDALIAHLPQVRIIHGRGTGALRKGIHNHLRKMRNIKSFRPGEFNEGGDGATVVVFK